MHVRLSRMESGKESYRNMKSQMRNSASQVESIASKYRGISCIDSRLGKLASIREEIKTCADQCGQIEAVLSTVTYLYDSCENRIIDRLEGVRPINAEIPSGMQTTMDLSMLLSGYESGEVSESELTELFTALFGPVEVIDDWSANAKLIGKWADLFGDFKFTKYLKEYADLIGKGTIFDIAGYLDDSKDLIEALNKGDLEEIEKIAQKWGAGFINKSLYSGGSVLKGIEGGVYLDFAWNLGKDITEKGSEFLQDPSIGSLAGFLWESVVENYGQAIWKEGTKLASGTISLVSDLVGWDFDEDDFNDAMDFLGGAFEDVYNDTKEAVAYAGEQIWNGISSAASWFCSLF